MKKKIILILQIGIEFFSIPFILIYAIISRFKKKNLIGLGPEPLINNVYHKMVLEKQGYKAETFVNSSYFITNKFDIDLSKTYNISNFYGRFMTFLKLIQLGFKYKIIYFYFNGGPIGLPSKILWKIEPFLYKIADVKTVIMPYGGDVQDLTRTNNLHFKHCMSLDYPHHAKRRVVIASKIDLWTKYANHIISGCDWVEYMYYWDTLMLAHFSIDTSINEKVKIDLKKSKTFKIFHAPNHKSLKGTEHLIKCIEELCKEGFDIELIMLTNVSNEEILNTIATVDLVADQFIIGWYAMFALEAMTLKKPVMCFLRKDFIDLYKNTGLITENEIPIINTPLSEIKTNIIWAYQNRDKLCEIGNKSREFVIKHHSIESVGKVFNLINKKVLNEIEN